jgi:hypothetical protein
MSWNRERKTPSYLILYSGFSHRCKNNNKSFLVSVLGMRAGNRRSIHPTTTWVCVRGSEIEEPSYLQSNDAQSEPGCSQYGRTKKKTALVDKKMRALGDTCMTKIRAHVLGL